MKVRLHPGAWQDLQDCAAFYEREASPAVAARFHSEFERTARLLALEPGIGTPRTQGRRGFPIAGFPYTVIDRPEADGIAILVVKHDRRRPSHGGDRR